MRRILLLLVSLFYFSHSQQGLNNGVPFTDSISLGGGYKYYSYPISHSDIYISVTPTFGDPDLFVSVLNPTPNTTSYQWYAGYYGADAITIAHTDARLTNRSVVYIGVMAFGTPSNYTILATPVRGIRMLTVGTAQQGATDAPDEYVYYAVDLPSLNVNVTAFVTTFSGDMDFFASNTLLPNRTSYQWAATGDANSIRIERTDANLRSRLYFAVYAALPASFSILVTVSHQVIALTDGIPQDGVVSIGSWAYYQLVVGPGSIHHDLTFSVTARTGDPDLYVANGTLPTFGSRWRSALSGSESLTLQHNDPLVCMPCTYYIGVYGFRASEFQVVATSSNATRLLSFGNSASGVIDFPNEFLYYQLRLSRNDVNVTIISTALSGQVDMFVTASLNNSDPVLPTRAVSTWSAVGSRNSTILIPMNAPGRCLAPCSLYVGVTSTALASFTVLAVGTQGVTTLTAGQPQNGYVARGEYQYFSFKVNSAHKDITFTLSPFGGSDPDMYVTTTNVTSLPPTTTRYTWMRFAAGLDILTIPYTDRNYCSKCSFIIGIYGYTASNFQILATTDAAIVTLVLGQPMRVEALANETEYFRAYLSNPRANVTIQTTLLTGNTDMYVSTEQQGIMRPGPSNYTWAIVGTGVMANDTLRIPDSDSRSCHVACWYYVAIRTLAGSTFDIVITMDNLAILLNDGVPQQGSVATRAYQYYEFVLRDPHSSLTIQLFAISGDPDLYVTNQANVTQPNAGNARWSATASGSDTIIIRPGTPNFGVQNSYFIGVYGWSAASYRLTVSTQHAAIIMTEGIPSTEAIADAGSHYTYFQAPVAILGNTTITISSLSGNGQELSTFVSPSGQFNNEPNATMYTWRLLGTGSLIITANDTSVCRTFPCSYLIGVLNTAPSTYTITYVVGATPVTLTTGQQQSGTLVGAAYQDYVYYPDQARTNDLTISLTSLSGNPDLYISCAPAPRSGMSTWNSTFYGNDMVAIRHVDPRWCPRAFYISVRAYFYTRYLIVATNNLVPLTLALGINQREYIDTNQWELFRYMHYAFNQRLIFTLTASSGSMDMYILASSLTPNFTVYNWTTANTPSQGNTKTITIDPPTVSPSAYCNYCQYSIGVYSSTGGIYDLLIRALATPTTLSSGVTVYSYGAAATNYLVGFYFYPLPGSDISIAAAASGSLIPGLALYIGTGPNAPIPTDPSTYQWAGQSGGASRSIRSDDATLMACLGQNTACRLYIVVSAPSPTGATYGPTFTVRAVSSEDTVVLDNGSPVQQYLSGGRYLYFRFSLHEDPLSNITFTTSLLSGYTRTCIGRTSTRPLTCLWSGYQSNTIKITTADPNHCNSADVCDYYISVYAYQISTFTLVAQLSGNSVTQLISGVAQVGHVHQREYAYFSMAVLPKTDLQVTVTPRTVGGALDLYMAWVPSLSRTSFAFSAAPSFTSTSSVVPGSSIGECSATNNCVLYFAVYNSRALVTDFSIQASSSGSVVTLSSGLRVSGTIKNTPGLYNYYSISVSNASTLYINPDICSGTAKAFVSQSTVTPSETNNIGSGTTAFSIAAQPGTYYIGVRSLGTVSAPDTSYRLTALAETTPGQDVPTIAKSMLTLMRTGNTYTISFTPVTPIAGGSFNDYEYTAYYQVVSQSSSGLLASCECATFGTASTPLSAGGAAVQIPFSGLDPTKSYQFNVVVRKQSSSYEATYSPLTSAPATDNNPNNNNGANNNAAPGGISPGGAAALSISIIIILLGAGFGYWYYKRRHQPALQLGQMVDEPPPPSTIVYSTYTGGPEPVAVERPKIKETKKSSLLSSGQTYNQLEEDDTNVYNPPVEHTRL